MQKNYSWNCSTCIYENSSCLKSIVDDLVVVCDEIINVVNSLSTNMTNAISANFTSTVSINFDDKKVTCEENNCIIHTISLVIICLLLLVVVSISCYYYYTRLWIKKEYALLY